MNHIRSNNSSKDGKAIFLVRHATPDRSGSPIPYHIPPGPDLSAIGLMEARQVGEYMALQRIGQIYSSPLERCIRTARIISEFTGVGVEILPELIELQVREEEEIVKARMLAGFEVACHSLAEGYPVVVVSHGGPIGVLLGALGMEPKTLAGWKARYEANPMPPAGIWRATRHAARQSWMLDFVFSPKLD